MPRYLKLLIAVSCPVFAVFAWNKLDDGYCIREGRVLTDGELINPALIKIVFNNNRNSVGLKNYLDDHPNCCAVERHPATRSNFDVATGFNVVEVEINYKKVYNADDLNKYYKYYKSYSSVSACGDFIKNEYGTSTFELETAFKIN